MEGSNLLLPSSFSFIKKVENMNRSKQIELVRKRNAELTKQLKDVKLKLQLDSELNMKERERAKDLISELEQIKKEWISIIKDLNDKKEKYSNLIFDLQEMKKVMISMGFKIPWYRKIINRLRGF